MSKRFNRGRRRAAELLVDLGAWAFFIPASIALRFEGWAGFEPAGAKMRVVIAIILVSAVSSGVGVVVLIRNGRPKVGSFEDIWFLSVRNLAAGSTLVVVALLTSPRLIPLSTCFTATAAATLLSMIWRGALRDRDQRLRGRSASAKPTIIFGGGGGGTQIIEAIMRDSSSDYRLAAILDDDPAKRDLTIRGVRVVGGRESIRSTADRLGATVLIIAMPGANSALIRELAKLGVEAGLEVLVLPAIADLLSGQVGVGDVRLVTEFDLLGRTVTTIDLDSFIDFIAGKRVLITGAGGSIGSEIARQVSGLGLASLTLLDRDESALHSLQLQLEGRALLDSRHLVVADIRDRDRLLWVFEEHRPEVVFHAAALKHLPLLEMYPTEAIKSNVFGTQNVLECAGAVGVTHFVNISTDKAANPVSVLGASKRLAEGLTASASEGFDGKYLSVRFGNVLGSRGTAIETFQAQIAAGGPVTVTDPEVSRFFMTVSEAVQLVFQAAVVGNDGEVMVLDMGEPVPIIDIAMQLIAQATVPIEIVYTGLRPGEKLHEDLFNDGEVGVRAVHPLIFHVPVPVIDCADLCVLGGIDDDSARLVMLEMVAGRMNVSPRQNPAC